MFRLVRFFLVCACILPAFLQVHAAEEAPAKTTKEINKRAAKYYKLLLRRPKPDYVFERFVDAWLEDADYHDIEMYLKAQLSDESDESKQLNNQLIYSFLMTHLGRDVEAIASYQAVLKKQPKHAQALYYFAKVSARELDFDTASKALTTAAASTSDEELRREIANLHGRLLVRSGRSKEAMKIWNAMLEKRPEDMTLREDLIELLVDEGFLQRAVDVSQELIKQTKDPYHLVQRSLRLAEIQLRRDKQDEALSIYNEAFGKVGQGSWLERQVLDKLEEIFRREDNITGLQEHFIALTAQYPERSSLQRRSAKIYIEEEEVDKAIEIFSGLIERAPNDHKLRGDFIDELLKAERFELANKHNDALITQQPRDAELLIAKAQIAKSLGKPEQVQKALDDFLTVANKSSGNMLRVARIYEQYEMLEQAEAAYVAAIETYADDPSLKESYAAYLYKSDKKDEALVVWRNLAETEDVSQLARVARALVNRGLNKEALNVLVTHEAAHAAHDAYIELRMHVHERLKEFASSIAWAQRLLAQQKDYHAQHQTIRRIGAYSRRAENTMELIKQTEKATSLQEICLRAELFNVVGDFAAADAALAPLVAKNEKLAQRMQIQFLRQRHDHAGAALIMKQMVAAHSNDSGLLQELIKTLAQSGEYDDALGYIAQWKELAPGSDRPWLLQSKILYQMGEDSSAVNILRHALRKFDNRPDIRARLADMCFKIGNHQEAERHYWALHDDAESTPQRLRWVAKLADVAESVNAAEDLLKTFEQRHQSNKKSIEPLWAIAEIHRKRYDTEEQREALLKATQIKPKNIDLLHKIAQLDARNGDFERSLEILDRAIAIDESNKTKQLVARVHFQSGDVEAGFRLIEDLAGESGVDPRDIENIASTLCQQGEWQRAYNFLIEKTQDLEADYRLRLLQAIALSEMGEIERAADEFIATYNINKEIPNLKTVPNQNRLDDWAEQLRGRVPNEAIELFKLSYGNWEVLAYKNLNRRRYFPGGRGQGISLPSSVDDAKFYALVHLHYLFHADQTTEEQAEAIAGKLDTAEINVAKYMRLISSGIIEDPEDMMGSLVDEHPEDEVVQAVFAMSLYNNPYATKERAERCYKLLKDKYPSLVTGSLYASFEETATDEEYQQFITHLKTIKDITTFEMAFFHTLDNQDAKSVFSQEQLTEIQEIGVEWFKLSFKEAKSDPRSMYWYAMQQLRSLLNNENIAGFVEIAELLMENKDSMTVPNWGRSSGNTVLQPLNMVPMLESVNPVLMTVLSTDKNNRVYYGEEIEVIGTEEIRKEVESISNVILRILLANKLEYDEIVKAGIEELKKRDKPSLDLLLLEAALAVRDEDHVEAVKVLNTARTFPMKAEKRKYIDGAIVSSAMLMNVNTPDEEKAKIKETGAQAALRLRGHKMVGNDRNELIDALIDLGESEAADQLEAKRQAQVATTQHHHVQHALDFDDAMEDLIGAGKEDEAVKTGVRLLRSWADAVAAGRNPPIHRWSLQNGLKAVLANDAVKNGILERMHPGDSTSHRRGIQYAMVANLFGETVNAKQVLEKLYAEKQNDAALLAHLLIARSKNSEAESLALLNKMTPKMEPQVSTILRGQLEIAGADGKMENMWSSLKVLAKWLHTLDLEQAKQFDLTWVLEVEPKLAGSWHVGNHYINDIYDEDDQFQHMDDERKKLWRERDALYDDLHKALLRFPQTAIIAFPKYHFRVNHMGVKSERDLSEIAKDILIQYVPSKKRIMAGGSHVYYSGSSRRDKTEYTATEWLIQSEFEKQKPQPDFTQLYAELSANEHLDMDAITLLGTLYTCEPETFIENLKAYKRLKSPHPVKHPKLQFQDSETEILERVIRCLTKRKITVDIGDLVIAPFISKAKKGQIHDVPPYLFSYLQSFPVEELSQKLQRISESLLGTDEERRTLVEKHFDEHSWRSSGPEGRVQLWNELIEGLMLKPEYFGFMVGLRKRSGFTHELDYEFRQRLDKWFGKERPKPKRARKSLLARLASGLKAAKKSEKNNEKKAEGEAKEDEKPAVVETTSEDEAIVETTPKHQVNMEFLLGLAASPLVYGIQDFDPVDVEYMNHGNLLKRIALKAKHDEALAHDVKQHLLAGEPTFGKILLQSLMDPSKDDKAKVLNYLFERKDVLEEISSKQRLLVLRVVSDAVGAGSDLSEDPANAWLREILANSGKDAANRILTIKAPKDLDFSIGDLDDKIVPILKDVLEVDEVLAEKVILHAEMLVKAPSPNSSLTTNSSFLTSVLSNLLSDAPSQAAIRLAYGLSAKDQTEVSSQYRHHVANAWSEYLKAPSAYDEALNKWYAAWKPDFEMALCSLDAVYYSFRGLKKDKLEIARNWVLAEAEDVSLAIQLTATAALLGKDKDNEELKIELLAKALPILNNEALSLNARLSLATILCADRIYYGINLKDEELARVAIRLLSKMWQRDLPISREVNRALANVAVTLPRAELLELGDGIIERYLDKSKKKRSRRTRPYWNINPFRSEQIFSRLLLVLSTGAKDKNLSKRFMKDLGNLDSDPGIWIHLMTSGQYEVIESVINKHWKTFDLSRLAKEQYDSELDTALQQYQESASDKGTAFLLRSIFQAIPGKVNVNEAESTRLTRLTALANELEGITFNLPGQFERVLEIIAIEAKALDPIKHLILDKIKDADPYAFITEGTIEERTRNLGLMRAALRIDIAAQSVDRLLAILQAINADKSSIRYRDNLAAVLKVGLDEFLNGNWTEWTKEEFSAWSPVLREYALLNKLMYGKRGNARKVYLEKTTSYLALVHILGEEDEALKTWLETLTLSQKNAIKDSMSWGTFWKKLSKDLFTKDSTFYARRDEIIVKILMHPVSLLDDDSHMEHFGILLDKDLMSVEAILKDGPAIAEALVNFGHSWASLARVQGKHGSFDDAILSWQKAIDEDHKSETWGFEQLELALSHKRTDILPTLIEAQAGRDLDAAEEKRLKSIKDRFQELAADEQADGEDDIP